MRSLITLLFLFILPWSTVRALYNGNPSFPMMPEQGFYNSKSGWFSFKLGYEWDWVGNRKLQLKGRFNDLRRHVQSSREMGNSGVVTMGICDRVELYSLLGAFSSETHYHPHKHTEVKFKTDSQFAWEIGGRVILAYWGDFQLGIDAKYFSYSPQIDRLTADGYHIHDSGAGFHYTEWQVGAGVSYRFTYVVPYAGVKYSNVRSKFYHLNAVQDIFPRKHFTAENQYPIGFFIGCGLTANKGIDLNAEFRFLDELAATVSADLRF